FGTAFLFVFLPWQVADPGSKAYVGVGAFNLVRVEAYRRAGGHAALPMDVVDDVKLGKRLREGGARQECGFSDGRVRVRWAVGLKGMIDGLTKNMFASLGFRLAPTLSAVFRILLLVVWPGLGLTVGPWGARLLCAGALAAMVWTVGVIRPVPRASALHGLAFPLAGLLMSYIILRSAVRTYRQGGVVWRGTLYPLAELRKGVV
ncbi:MAG TPA: family 2 glycosyl transferase, partial [Candidatus Methylomirabilis sp.]